jgi:O-acetyl-ADP-ribose deacetylase (regulator of RNase III)
MMAEMQIHVARSELIELPVDAVVCPTNSEGLMVEGVAAELREYGGPKIEAEARASAPIAVGAALVTAGGTLHARHVIHAPMTETPGMKVGVESVRRATRAALIAAAQYKFETIAMPGIGIGPNGLAVDEAARAMVDELRAHRQPKPATIYLVSPAEEQLTAFAEALRVATTIS